jgi:hypothetical protein
MSIRAKTDTDVLFLTAVSEIIIGSAPPDW